MTASSRRQRKAPPKQPAAPEDYPFTPNAIPESLLEREHFSKDDIKKFTDMIVGADVDDHALYIMLTDILHEIGPELLIGQVAREEPAKFLTLLVKMCGVNATIKRDAARVRLNTEKLRLARAKEIKQIPAPAPKDSPRIDIHPSLGTSPLDDMPD